MSDIKEAVPMAKKSLDEILSRVRKPGRYLGNEWNVSKKDFTKQSVKFAVCFPDIYELGMSNLGVRIIYGLLNSMEGICCERAFLPDTDMRALLAENNIPLFSLESKRPLKDFDFLGFSLGYELDYTNVLAVLDLSGIPLLSKDRTLTSPLIIAGGSCVSNPEPLADFIDIFLIGEAEEALPELIEIYRNKHSGFGADSSDMPISRRGLLLELAKVEGIYIPSLYSVQYGLKGDLSDFRPLYPSVPVKIKKRIVKNLDQSYYPSVWLTPHIQIVHDRAAVELMRGCPNRCNFCQASPLYQNLRIRSAKKVLELSRDVLSSSGYEEISFLSLSTSEYPYLNEVISALNEELCSNAVAISLPSLRPKSYLGRLIETISKVRKPTLTFAPEAGSQRLRGLINKDYAMDDFFEAISFAYKSGWQKIKLYFMIGLADEDYADLDGILEIAQKASSLRKECAHRPGEVRLSISFFIPKPHTSFQRHAMDSADSLKEKINYLRNKSRRLSRHIRLNFHDLNSSILEAVFSRGDRALGQVLLEAYKRGCVLDGWKEHFKADSWFDAFRDTRVDYTRYLKNMDNIKILPWEHILLNG